MPADGESLESQGLTLKTVPLRTVPPWVMTAILPLTAAAGTVVVICVAEVTVKLASAPPNLTASAPSRLVPVKVTVAPTRPDAGVEPPASAPAGR